MQSPGAAVCSEGAGPPSSTGDALERPAEPLLAASMRIIRTALEVSTALRMALSMLGLYPPATSVPRPTCVTPGI